MPEGVTHVRAIEQLIAADPQISRRGFPQAVKELVVKLGCDQDCVPAGFLPDAFKIDHENEEIVMYEVEVSRPVSSTKLRKMAMFWEAWDGEDHHDWLPTLCLVDHQGRIVSHVRLCDVLGWGT